MLPCSTVLYLSSCFPTECFYKRFMQMIVDGIMEEDEDPYESLPTHSLAVHLMAGAAAGLAEHCVMFPIDSVKTRMQSLCPCPEKSCRTPWQGLMSIIRTEGIYRPMRGVSSVAAGAIPAHALYFTIYDKVKHILTNGRASHSNSWAYMVAGGVATCTHDAVMNPAEVIKQRMQMCGSPYRSVIECARCIYRQEGVAAFYRSYGTQLLLNLPFQTVHFVIYEFGQQLTNPDRRYNPASHVIAGGAAGGVAAAMTCPLDVVKTVLNTQQRPTSMPAMPSVNVVRAFTTTTSDKGVRRSTVLGVCPASYDGAADAVRGIYASRGAMGFFSGFQARVLVSMPATALAWSVYEGFKFVLGRSHSE